MRLEFYSLDRNNGSQVGDNFMLFWLNDELSMRKNQTMERAQLFPTSIDYVSSIERLKINGEKL